MRIIIMWIIVKIKMYHHSFAPAMGQGRSKLSFILSDLNIPCFGHERRGCYVHPHVSPFVQVVDLSTKYSTSARELHGYESSILTSS